MSDGSTLLVTPCKLPSTNFPALMKTKSPGLKRTISDLDVQSCLSSSIVIRSRTKRRRCIAWDERPSKIRWNSVLEEQRGDNGECRLHAVADNEKWYSVSDVFLISLGSVFSGSDNVRFFKSFQDSHLIDFLHSCLHMNTQYRNYRRQSTNRC